MTPEPEHVLSVQGQLIPYRAADRRVWAVAVRAPERLSLARLLEVLGEAVRPTGPGGRSAFHPRGVADLVRVARARWEAAGSPGAFPDVPGHVSRSKLRRDRLRAAIRGE
jgi:hypothetical protein